jgi:hypothetical protein
MRCARLVLSVVLLAVATLVLLTVPRAAAAAETYRLQWGSYDTFTIPQWAGATTNVTLEDWVAPDGSGTGVHLFGPTGTTNDRFGMQFDLFFRCGTGNPTPCTVASNFSFPFEGSLLLYRDYPHPGDATFSVQVDWEGHDSGQMIGVGTKQTAPPTPGPTVTIKTPANGQTVSGSTAITVTASGFASGSLRYFISIDGAQKWFSVTTSTTITQWWNTTSVPAGTHSISVRVEDSASHTVTSSTVNVIVKH